MGQTQEGMTQKETILGYLKNNDWVCGTVFQKVYIPEYRTRINDLRKAGHRIITRRCQAHKHAGGMQEWMLTDPQAAPRPLKLSENTKDFLLKHPSSVTKQLTLI